MRNEGKLSESNCKEHHQVAFANIQWLFLTSFSSWNRECGKVRGLAVPSLLQLLDSSDQQIELCIAVVR